MKSNLERLQERIEETKAKSLEKFKQAELQSLRAWSEELRELLVSELNTTKNDINEILEQVREQMQTIKEEQMQTRKKHWIIPTLIGLLTLAGIILLMRQPQEITEKEVRSWLQENYKLIPISNGWQLIEKKKEKK